MFVMYYIITTCSVECHYRRSDKTVLLQIWWNGGFFAVPGCATTSPVTAFTALHGMPARTSYEKVVRLSVCKTRGLWQNGRKICPHFYTIRKITLYKQSKRGYISPLCGEFTAEPNSTKIGMGPVSRGRRRIQWRQSFGGPNFALLHRNDLSPVARTITL